MPDMKMKKLVVPFKLKSIESDEDFFYFEGYASTFGNVDLGGDVVERGAFQTSINELNSSNTKLKVLWQHRHSEPLGIFVKFYEDDKGLFVKGKLPKDDDFVKGRVMPQMRVGSVDKMSIGYWIRENGYDVIDGIWHLKDLKLIEVSLVTLPMNELADVTDFSKSRDIVSFMNLPLADRKREWDSTSAIGRIRKFTASEDAPSKRYKRAFLWFDKENEDKFEAYKLPIADIVNDQMKAVPMGIFSAAAVISGTRGGLNIPENESKGVEINIEKYYRKMDIESPFNEKSFTITSFKDHHPRDIEHLLIMGKLRLPKMEQKQAKAFISTLKKCDVIQRVKKNITENWSDVLNGLKQIK